MRRWGGNSAWITSSGGELPLEIWQGVPIMRNHTLLQRLHVRRRRCARSAGQGQKGPLDHPTVVPAPVGDALSGATGTDAGPLFHPIEQNGRISRRRLGESSVQWVLQQRATAAGVADFSPHDLRRTYISTRRGHQHRAEAGGTRQRDDHTAVRPARRSVEACRC